MTIADASPAKLAWNDLARHAQDDRAQKFKQNTPLTGPKTDTSANGPHAGCGQRRATKPRAPKTAALGVSMRLLSINQSLERFKPTSWDPRE